MDRYRDFARLAAAQVSCLRLNGCWRKCLPKQFAPALNQHAACMERVTYDLPDSGF